MRVLLTLYSPTGRLVHVAADEAINSTFSLSTLMFTTLSRHIDACPSSRPRLTSGLYVHCPYDRRVKTASSRPQSAQKPHRTTPGRRRSPEPPAQPRAKSRPASPLGSRPSTRPSKSRSRKGTREGHRRMQPIRPLPAGPCRSSKPWPRTTSRLALPCRPRSVYIPAQKLCLSWQPAHFCRVFNTYRQRVTLC